MCLEHKPAVLKQDGPSQKCSKNISWKSQKRFSEHALVGQKASQVASPLLDPEPIPPTVGPE
eukprot:6294973-Pyramimonas_sp.AAC.1